MRMWMWGIVGLGACLAVASAVARPGATWAGGSYELGVPAHGNAYRGGVVTTTEPFAAEVGARILEGGGNAVDAAAAVLFALGVVEPQSSGLGGGGYMLLYLADTDEILMLDSRSRAPEDTTADMYQDQSSSFLRSTSGYVVGIPGALMATDLMLREWGTITLADALQPAIDAAEQGVPVSARLADSLDSARLRIGDDPRYGEVRRVFLPDGNPLQEGDELVQPDLAGTFRVIAEQGIDAFYDCGHGAGIARAIIDTQQATRADNPQGLGRMTCADLASVEVAIRAPVCDTYRGYTICTAPPPSSGGVALLQMLKMLERFPLGAGDRGFGFGSFNTLNVMQEAMRLATADRFKWIGDPDHVQVPVQGLLADAYVAQRSDLIQVGNRRTGITAGDPRPFDSGDWAPGTASPFYGDEDRESADTTHFSIIDGHGNMVSYTTTISSTWGPGLMVQDAGFMLNNHLSTFRRTPSYDPDPDAYDPGANDAAPFKRPRSSMTPVMVFDGGEAVAAYGSPGGGAIISTVLGITLDLIDHGFDIEQAVDAPRISLTSARDSADTELEDGFDSDVLHDLEDLGYTWDFDDAIGAVQAVVRSLQTGKQYGVADHRRIGGVAGVRR